MSNNPRVVGLPAFIYPKSLEEFLNTEWPEQAFVSHGLKDSVRELTELPFLKSLDAMLNHWPKSIQAHLPDASDESSSIDCNASDARKLFSNHLGLLFNDVQTLSPVLKNWLVQIHQDLGLPAMTHGRCMVYATPDGKGTAPHFDQNINFVLQLTGTKKWWLAPNSHVKHPSQRHTMKGKLDAELASYAQLPFPTEMPKEAISIELKPGSLLFLPQGYWHSTEAQGEALSLNFTFSQPSYLDLFTAALRSRLLLSPEWRELADGVSSTDPERREYAEQKFDALLLELTGDLPHWNASDILGATEV